MLESLRVRAKYGQKKLQNKRMGVLDTEEKMGVYGPTPQDHVS